MLPISWQIIEQALNSEIKDASEALEVAADWVEVNRLQAKIELARDLLDSLKRTQK